MLFNRIFFTSLIWLLQKYTTSSSLAQQRQSVQNNDHSDLQQTYCPILTVTLDKCVGSFLFIRHINGTLWNGGFNARSISGCYDKDQCYLIEAGSTVFDCALQVVMDGATKLKQSISRESSTTGRLFFIGNCITQCPGETALVLSHGSQIQTDDVKYFLYRSDLGSEEGTISHGDARISCIDLKKCNLLEVNGYGNYYLLQGNEVQIEGLNSELKQESYGKWLATQSFGDCMRNCADIKIIIKKNYADDRFSYTIEEDGHLLEEEKLVFEDKEFCLNPKKCNKIDVKGNATYMIIDGTLISHKRNGDTHFIGSCQKICDSKPTLASTQRAVDIFSVISSISTMEDLVNIGNWRYDAICWLIYDDPKQLQATDPSLVQRYVLALFYLSTDGWSWSINFGFMDTKDECSWVGVVCVDKFVTELQLFNNNLAGTVISELYVLSHLEKLDLMRNTNLIGSLPRGIGRLNRLKFLRLFYNDITGTIPEDLFLIESIETVIFHNTLMTGSIPINYKNLSRLNRLSVGLNLQLTGTIPDWIIHCKELVYLRGGNNEFTGTLPDGIATLTKLKIVALGWNKLSGTIPSQMFRLPSLESIILEKNRLSGSIPNDIQSTKLNYIALFQNILTGTIPSQLSKLTHLQSLRLESNKFVGEYPYELKKLTSLSEVRLQNNLITGTIPYDECEQFHVLSSDCFIPRNIDCKCCTDCYGLFNSNHDILPCPTSTLKIIYDVHHNDLNVFELETVSKPVTRTDGVILGGKSDDSFYSQCLSPTGCFKFSSEGTSSFRIVVDNKTILDELPSVASVHLGYSSNGVMKQDTCDDFLICNRTLRAGTPKRSLLDLITRFSEINDENIRSSKQYSAICWWLDDLDRKSDDSLQNIALVQRYILALLYFSTDGRQWQNKDKWLSNESECNWFGISCEVPGVVNRLNLSSNNMRGYVPPELGELKGLEHLIMNSNLLTGKIPVEIVKLQYLKTLKLSNNMLIGTIHPEIRFLENVRYLDLEDNRISGYIPTQIGTFDKMEYISLADNPLSGKLPVELKNLVQLKSLSFRNNLLRGSTHMIDGLINLEMLDLSNNYFTGSLPLYGENQPKLEFVLLNNNRFSGAIPSDIDKSISIKELILSDNELTGSLPSTVGKLHNISKLSISYNSLKGLVPADLSNLSNLKLLHVQSNKFKGKLNLFNYTISSFVSDCGNTETTSSLIECSGCSQCCNIEGYCINQGSEWLSRAKVIAFERSSEIIIISTFVAISVCFYLCCLVLMALKVKLPALPFKVGADFQQYSVARFYLSSYKSAWLIALFLLIIECIIGVLFIKTGDKTFDGNLLIHSVLCPEDNLECIDLALVTYLGWLICSIILVAFLLPDFLDGALLVYESIMMRKHKAILAGVILMSRLGFFMAASFIYLQASSISDIAIVKDTVIVLFLNKMDEAWYSIMQIIAPRWLDEVENDISKCKIEGKKRSNICNAKKEILSTSIQKLRKKIDCFELLPEKLKQDLKYINSTHSAEPGFPDTYPSNENNDKVRWNLLMRELSKIKTNILSARNNTKDLHNANMKRYRQQKITDFFQPR